MKVRATKIVVTRAEGRVHECVTETLEGGNVWEKANATLGRWSRTAPGAPGKPGGGYDKCDFTVTYEDGEEYEGRYDLRGDEWPSLENHMAAFLGCYSGRMKPAHMKQADYERFLKYHELEGHCAQYAKFMDTYEVGPQPQNAQERFLEELGA
jgi:hypothetical protein